MGTKSESQSIDQDALLEAGRKAAVDAEAKVQVAKAALELRDQCVVRLYDAGVGVARVAAVMLISRARVSQIVAAHGG